MTRDTGQVVRLSGRDWCGLAALAIGVLTAITTQYLRHDRLLTEVLVRQAAMAERVGQVERAVERLEAGAMARPSAVADPPTPSTPGAPPPLSLSTHTTSKNTPHQNSHG